MNRPAVFRGNSRTSLLQLASSCFTGDMDDAAAALVAHASARRGGYVCLCNVHVLTLARQGPDLELVVREAAIRFPDGAPVAWLLRRLGRSRAERIPGPDLFPRVLSEGRSARLRHFLVGSTDATLDVLSQRLGQRFPGVEVVGTHCPPYADRPPVEQALVEAVEEAQPHLIWVSLGAPKQELWMARAVTEMPAATFVGVGAAFDFMAGTKMRAPAGMRRFGFEWLHRLVTEPRRLTGRYVSSNSRFIGAATVELLRLRVQSHAVQR